MKSLKGSKTAENLLKSFAGESQASSRYSYYSEIAEKEGYIEIAGFLTEISNQEREHGRVFYKYLKEGFVLDENLEIRATYSTAFHNGTLENLKAAVKEEEKEWECLYPAFADIAEKEGFLMVANTFRNIAEIEKHHENKFKKIIKTLEKRNIFHKNEAVNWSCNNCGFVIKDYKAPESCVVCTYPKGYFKVDK